MRFHSTSDRLFPMTTHYKYSTHEADYTFVANPDNNDAVFVYASERSEIDMFIDSLELAGVADGRYFEDLEAEEDFTAEIRGKNGYPLTQFVEVNRIDLALFFQSEALHFIGVSADG